MVCHGRFEPTGEMIDGGRHDRCKRLEDRDCVEDKAFVEVGDVRIATIDRTGEATVTTQELVRISRKIRDF